MPESDAPFAPPVVTAVPIPPAQSPTGTPVVPPKAVPWFTVATCTVAGGLEVGASSITGGPPWLVPLLHGLAVLLAGVAGCSSPGFRKAVVT